MKPTWMSLELSLSLVLVLGLLSLHKFPSGKQGSPGKAPQSWPRQAEPRAGALWETGCCVPQGLLPFSEPRSSPAPPATSGKELGKGLGLLRMTSAASYSYDGLIVLVEVSFTFSGSRISMTRSYLNRNNGSSKMVMSRSLEPGNM